ncbi:hypothetical protein JB92DRAFT_2875723 [Gautieria morchelliformis]|nr:hypothetical protein JB92DRAFT_3013767 [Gautieria morchelliformis]KAF8525424.1 hypothetical protein JB92DRAFT_2875723 [Gautieria morchelliformis]
MLPLIVFSAASVVLCAGDTSGPRLLYGTTPFVCAFRGGGVWRRLCSIIFAICHSFRFLVLILALHAHQIVADTYSQG